MEPTYHDLSLPKLNYSAFVRRDGINPTNNQGITNDYSAKPEPFTANFNPDAPSKMDMTTTNIVKNNLVLDRKNMLTDPNADYSSRVSDPYGYGYTSSLNEARNQDAKDILMQESTMFTLAAIAGVSIIVAGLLFTSSSDALPPTPAP